jgi:MOSC domain-containing protein YiiM
MRPRIASVNVSQGGVPKLPVACARITEAGIAGDRQRNLRYHGGPDRALCLWSLELIEALRDEGHPVFPGSAGENVTVSGVDWSHVVPGARLRLGPVLVEVTSYTAPCRTIRASFALWRTSRISQEKHPGWSRVYARVLEVGEAAAGDPVAVELVP